MEREKGKLKLRDAVKRLDEELWHKLEVVWGKAAAGILDAQVSTSGSQAGYPHVKAVEDNLSALIPDLWKGGALSALELFLLSAAACLHDVGKAGTGPGDHGHVSWQEVFDRGQDFGLENGEAQAVAWLVHSHNTKRLDNLRPRPFSVRGTEEVRLRPLAALLCLADTLHCDSSRVSRQVTGMTGSSSGDSPTTKFRVLCRGWTFDQNGDVQIQADARTTDDVETYFEGFGRLKREVEPIAAILEDSGFPHRLVPWLDDARVAIKVALESQRRLPEMDYYHEADAGIFRGREADTEKLYGTLVAYPVSLLVAGSGAGKSSLVCAGLFPYLGGLGTWKYVWCRPRDDPSTYVPSQILHELLPDSGASADTIESALEQVLRHHAGHRVLVVLDQFEDIGDALVSRRLDDLRRVLVGTLAGRFTDLRFLLVYRDDAQSKLGPWLQDISGSRCGLPPYYLPPLRQDGAIEALRALFQANEIGCEGDGLLEHILADISSGERGLYPPFLQMVARALADAATAKDKIVTAESYAALGGAAAIIANYLIGRLEEFKDQRPIAEQVLKAVVHSSGRKAQASVEDIVQATGLEQGALRAVIAALIDKRMLRNVSADSYEPIHDYFGQLVNETLVSSQERRLKQLRELLAAKAASYPVTHSTLSTAEMLQLYSAREQVYPTGDEKVLLLHSCLAGAGPAWYWLRESSPAQCIAIVEEVRANPDAAAKMGALKATLDVSCPAALALARSMLKDLDRDVRLAAVEAVVKLGGAAELPALREMLKDEGWNVRQAAVEVVGRLGGAADLPALREMLKDQDEDVRRAAVEAVVKLAGAADLLALREMLKDRNRDVRLAAVEAVMELGGAADLPALRGMLRDDDEDVRRAVTWAVMKLGGAADLPALRGMLRDDDEDVRRAAAEAVMKLGGAADLPELRGMLMDEDRNVRLAAVEAVVELGGAAELPALRVKLMDEDRNVRLAAVEAVVELGGAAELPALREMLKDEDEDVRLAAVKVVERLGGAAELPALREMLKDEDEDVRRAAVEAVGKLGVAADLPALREMLKDEDWKVREAAVEVIGKLGGVETLAWAANVAAELYPGDTCVSARDLLIRLDQRLYCPIRDIE